MQARHRGGDRGGDFGAVLDRKARAVELRDLAQRRADDHARIGAGGARLGELGLDLAGAAREGGVDRAVERQRRAVSHDRQHVVDVDRLVAVRIERELADLVARGAAAAPADFSHIARSGALRLRSPASITTRQSAAGGAASSASTAAVKLRPPALTQTARRPPNSGNVWASSTRRLGSSASASPSSRASPNGSAGSSTAALTSASTRSRTSPASGPNTSAIGRRGSGRATKASISPVFRATMVPFVLGSSCPAQAGRPVFHHRFGGYWII